MLNILTKAFVVFFQAFSVVTPLLNYLPQYFVMAKTQSTGSFSKQICHISILSNLLKIAYWFHKPFEVCLLVQAAIAILLHLLLISKFNELNEKKSLNMPVLGSKDLAAERSTLLVMAQRMVATYLSFVTAYIVLVLVFVWLESSPLAELTCGFACLLDVILPVPQIISNWRLRSVRGLR
jgi:hypothetical protein